MDEIDGRNISDWIKRHQSLDINNERSAEIATIAFRLNRVTLDYAMTQETLDDPSCYFRALRSLAEFKKIT